MGKSEAAILLATAVLQRKQVDPRWDELAFRALGIDPTKECTCVNIWRSECLRHHG